MRVLAPGVVDDVTERESAVAIDVGTTRHGAGRQLWRRFATNRLALLGLVAFILLGAVAIAAPLLTPAGYADVRYVASVYAFPSRAHLFGVDAVGRDFFSRNVYAVRVSLSIGFLTAIVSALIGIPLGAVAGYFAGPADWAIQRLLEVFSVVPPFLVAILLSTFSAGGFLDVVLVVGATSWVPMCRLVRADVLSLREEDFVLAARAAGVGPAGLIVRHLLPNALGPMIVCVTLTIPAAIIAEAGLSYLGVGIDPPTPSWGSMIADGVADISYYWHLTLFPVLMLTITILSLLLIADGLRDALDPTLIA